MSTSKAGAALRRPGFPSLPSRLPSLLAPGAVLLLAGLLAACGPAGEIGHIFQGPTMGTRYTVKVVAPIARLDETGVAALEATIVEQLEGVNGRMSTYQEDSELSRFNRYRDPQPFAFSADTMTVLHTAQEVSVASGGAFDVTVGPLVNAWGFGPGPQPVHGPDAETLAELRRHVGHDKLELDEAALTVRKLDPEVYCDLSAVAKGYAVDRVADALEAAGIHRYMVEVGGEVRTGGLNAQGEPWSIGIERPVSGERAVQRVLPLSGLAMATSGDYRNFYELDGRRVSHTIDPRTGEPVSHSTASVSVVHPSCMVADAWATALLVLGSDEGYRLAEELKLPVLFLIHSPGGGIREQATSVFQALSTEPQPGDRDPTEKR